MQHRFIHNCSLCLLIPVKAAAVANMLTKSVKSKGGCYDVFTLPVRCCLAIV